MHTLEAISQQLQIIKKEHNEFVVGPLHRYQQDYAKAIKEVIDTLQWQKPAIQKLIFQALQQKSHIKDARSFDELIDTPTQKLEIKLDLVDLFRAGYSTNVDLEIPQDIEYLKGSPIVDVSIKDAKPLFHKERDDRVGVRRRQKNGDPIINTNLGTLFIETKKEFLGENVPHKPMFARKIDLLSFNTMGLGNMNNLEMYRDSDRLPDQLAYCFYTQTKNNVDNFMRLWDHQRYSGINGLSWALCLMLTNYIENNTDSYQQGIYSPYQDLIANSPVIEEFNIIFDGYISIDITSKPGSIIYKLGPKLKQ